MERKQGRKFSGQKPGKPRQAKRSNKPSTSNPEDGIRLNKYIASTGLCSRREADNLIKEGLITLNGEPVTELGVKFKPGDEVKYNGEKLKTERLVYVLMNKPRDYITTLRDPHAKRTVMDIIGRGCKERIYPVGRLDRNTTGVLLLTNDGELAKKLTHPSHKKMKVYQVSLDKKLSQSDFEKIKEGFTLEDGFISADELNYTNDSDKRDVGIEIHSGRNHIVRRIFEHLDYKVIKLDRVYFAGLTKKGLNRGMWRFLNEKEVGILKMGAYK